MTFEKLFSPIKIRGMELRNRIVFPAMGTKMATEDRFVTQKLINYHVARAEGGNGLNMVEVASVHTPSAPKKFISISEDKYIPGLKKLVDGIHQGGAKAGIQLWQGGLAVAGDPEAMIVVPSDLPIKGTEHTIPAASKETIKEIVEAFGKAAKRAVEAGFDCIEFHAAHNYTPHSFLSPALNHRTDEYGGSFENRARYLLESIEAIRSNIPEEMPLFMRIDAHDDYLENGLTIEDVIRFCKLAKEAGVDVLDVSRGNIITAGIKYEVPPIDIPRGFNVENASKIRQETGMITIAVGRINDPAQAEKILEEEKADMVVMGRAQLADPEFCNKAQNNDVESIIKCVGCNQGCYDGFVSTEMPHITCLRNPTLGLEEENKLVPTNHPKKVLIAGAGIGGLEVAITLKKRGHNPIICESSERLGGQFMIAGMAPRKEEMKDAVLSMGKQAEKAGIEIRLSTPVTEDLIKEIAPDEVIVAIGASPLKLNVPGGDLYNVVSSHEVLMGKPVDGKGVVVVGGGLVGLEVAEHLAEKGKEVTVLEMLDEIGKDLGQLRKIAVNESIYEAGIKTMVNTKCLEIKEDRVIVEKDGEKTEIECDNVVIAIGSRSNNSENIILTCKELNIPYHIIGDACKARRALNAVAEANEVARQI
ncbi:FAD-dependent oxidoreductase [Alkalibaculum bacchi]|uniref:bile acid Fe-S flavoenzyme BaiCD n=1 Tax=Alkalibaculum bacchi TaxID=645887 RepID=UPI0026E948AD|nr:FAD-dependent oxidoreductase [Alkalibaculum bacchi]